MVCSPPSLQHRWSPGQTTRGLPWTPTVLRRGSGLSFLTWTAAAWPPSVWVSGLKGHLRRQGYEAYKVDSLEPAVTFKHRKVHASENINISKTERSAVQIVAMYLFVVSLPCAAFVRTVWCICRLPLLRTIRRTHGRRPRGSESC